MDLRVLAYRVEGGFGQFRGKSINTAISYGICLTMMGRTRPVLNWNAVILEPEISVVEPLDDPIHFLGGSPFHMAVQKQNIASGKCAAVKIVGRPITASWQDVRRLRFFNILV